MSVSITRFFFSRRYLKSKEFIVVCRLPWLLSMKTFFGNHVISFFRISELLTISSSLLLLYFFCIVRSLCRKAYIIQLIKSWGTLTRNVGTAWITHIERFLRFIVMTNILVPSPHISSSLRLTVNTWSSTDLFLTKDAWWWGTSEMYCT